MAAPSRDFHCESATRVAAGGYPWSLSPFAVRRSGHAVNGSKFFSRRDGRAAHIRLYFLVWAGYFGLLALLPVQYSTLQALSAYCGMMLWVGVSTFVAYVTHHLCERQRVSAVCGIPAIGHPL